MKKVFLLFAIVVATSTTSFISPAYSNTHSVAASQVPEEVTNSFNAVVTDIMNNWYPGNSGWDASSATWTRDKGAWECTGDILLNGGGGGINVIRSSFKNTGEFEYLNYNVIQ